VGDDLGFGEEVGTIDVVGVVVRQDDVTHAVGPQFAFDEGDELSRLYGEGEGIHDDSPGWRRQYSGRHLGVDVADKHMDILGNPIDPHCLIPLTPRAGVTIA